MADVSNGPVASMPGARSVVSRGTMCDEHPHRLAVRRLQGETDSFGCEYHDLCQECLDKISKHQEDQLAEERLCEWCGNMSTGVRPRRDYDEGSYGRLWDACPACIRKDAERGLLESDDYYGEDD